MFFVEEDVACASINRLHRLGGVASRTNPPGEFAGKIWAVLLPRDYSAFLQWLQTDYPALIDGNCSSFISHRDLVLDPRIVARYFPVFLIVQQPGDVVFTAPGAFHWGLNIHESLASSINFVPATANFFRACNECLAVEWTSPCWSRCQSMPMLNVAFLLEKFLSKTKVQVEELNTGWIFESRQSLIDQDIVEMIHGILDSGVCDQSDDVARVLFFKLESLETESTAGILKLDEQKIDEIFRQLILSSDEVVQLRQRMHQRLVLKMQNDVKRLLTDYGLFSSTSSALPNLQPDLLSFMAKSVKTTSGTITDRASLKRIVRKKRGQSKTVGLLS